jgi:hypothetical protein
LFAVAVAPAPIAVPDAAVTLLPAPTATESVATVAMDAPLPIAVPLSAPTFAPAERGVGGVGGIAACAERQAAAVPTGRPRPGVDSSENTREVRLVMAPSSAPNASPTL